MLNVVQRIITQYFLYLIRHQYLSFSIPSISFIAQKVIHDQAQMTCSSQGINHVSFRFLLIALQ